MSSSPFFSVIMPAFNGAQYISKAIESVINQTYTDWELIVIDDCSTDDTARVIDRYAESNSRIKYLKTEKNGRSAGMTRAVGIAAAKGQYIAFLDSDDLYDPKKLAIHHQTFLNNPNINFIYTNYNFVDQGYNFIQKRKRPLFERGLSRLLPFHYVTLFTNPFCTSTIAAKSDILKSYIDHPLPALLSEDWLMWNDLIQSAKINRYYDTRPLTDYMIRKHSLSNNTKSSTNINYHGIAVVSILLSRRRINLFQWCCAVSVRLVRNVITRRGARL